MPRAAAPFALVLAAGLASAQPAGLAVQTDQSSVSAEICLTPPGLSTECDTDSSAVSGSLVIAIDNYTAPSLISIHDFTIALTGDLHYNMDWGFLGGVNLDLTDAVVAYATPGDPTGAAAVDGAGSFEFPLVQAVITGTGAYAGYGPIIGPLIGSGTFNLADFGVVDSAIAGNVAVSGGVITVSGAQSFYNEGEINGVTASIDGTAVLVAVGDVPACYADYNGDGGVNTLDVLAFLNDWTVQDPGANCDRNAIIDTRDVLCFLNAWNAGC